MASPTVVGVELHHDGDDNLEAIVELSNNRRVRRRLDTIELRLGPGHWAPASSLVVDDDATMARILAGAVSGNNLRLAPR